MGQKSRHCELFTLTVAVPALRKKKQQRAIRFSKNISNFLRWKWNSDINNMYLQSVEVEILQETHLQNARNSWFFFHRWENLIEQLHVHWILLIYLGNAKSWIHQTVFITVIKWITITHEDFIQHLGQNGHRNCLPCPLSLEKRKIS